IEMTPTVHFDHDVTLKVKIEVTSQSGSVTISGVTEPILSQRVIDQVIRLREGEASILGGIENNQETQNWTGIPGLSSIPILKYLFGSKDHTIADDDIVFVVVPHIVRSQDLDQANLRAIDTGSGQSIDLRRADGAQPNSASSMVIHPSAVSVTPLGSVPGASADAAAPALLAQLRAAAQNTGNTTPAQPPANPPPPAAPRNAAAAPPPPVNTPQPAAEPAAGRASFAINSPSTPQAAGSSFQVPIVLNSGTDIASVPIQLQYDPAKLSLVNVAAGDLLNRDGQAVALVHRDDGPGNLTVVTARPPGAVGITGTGTVCVLTFQAKAAGTTSLNLNRAGAVDSKQQPIQAQTSQASIVIQ
ncbi:MAG TPA: cohesin domain-containing protein, partial [Terracidiphilus sp.]|nr:cohesin domain-containing protein [Terracidiphilus sp.]